MAACRRFGCESWGPFGRLELTTVVVVVVVVCAREQWAESDRFRVKIPCHFVELSKAL